MDTTFKCEEQDNVGKNFDIYLWNEIGKHNGYHMSKIVQIAFSKNGFSDPVKYSKLSEETIENQIVPFIRKDLYNFFKIQNPEQLQELYGEYEQQPQNFEILEGEIDFIIGTSKWVAELLKSNPNHFKDLDNFNLPYKRSISEVYTVDDNGFVANEVEELEKEINRYKIRKSTDGTLFGLNVSEELQELDEKKEYVLVGRAGILYYIKNPLAPNRLFLWFLK